MPVRAMVGPNARWQFVLLYAVPERAKEHAVGKVLMDVTD